MSAIRQFQPFTNRDIDVPLHHEANGNLCTLGLCSDRDGL